MNHLTLAEVQHLQAAAEEVCQLLSRLQTRFQALTNPDNRTLDQTLVAVHGYSYAELTHLIGTFPDSPEIREALSIVGLLPAVETYLRALATTIKPRLHVPSKPARTTDRLPSPPAAAA